MTGTHYRFKADVANTAASTINFNGQGAKTIKKAAGGITTDIAANDMQAGQWVDLVYDGTNMQMQSTLGNAAAGGGGTPGGTGTEFQYRAGTSTFGAVANTAIVNGGTNTLAAALAANAEITIPADVTQTTSALAVSTADTFLKFLSGRKLTQTTNGVDVIQVTGSRFGLFGAALDCNSNTSAEYALKVNADYTNVERSTVQNCGVNGGGNGLIAITGGVNHHLVGNLIFTQTGANSEYGIRVESVDAPISGTDISHNYIEVFNDRKAIFIKQNTANAMSDVTASFNTIHHTGTGIDVHSDSISAGPLGVKIIGNGFTATGVSGNPVVSIFGMRSSVLSLNTMSGAGFFNNNAPFLTAHDTYESAIVGNAGYMVGTSGRLLQSLDAAHNVFVGNTGFGTNAPSGGGAFEGSTSSTAGVPWSDNDVVGNNVNLDTGAGVDCFLAWPNSNNGTAFRNQFSSNNCDGDSTAGSKGVELKLGTGTGISAGDNFVGPNKLSNLEQGVVVGASVTNTTILPQSFTNVKVKYNVSNPATQLTPVYHAGEQDLYPTTSATASAVIPAVMETPPLAPKFTCANAGGSLATNTIFFQYVYNNGTSNYSAPSTEASCAVTGPSGQVTVTAPIYFPPNATGWSVFDSTTTGTASKKLQAASSACQNLSSASNCVINVLAAGAALSTTATASAGPTSCTPISGDLCLTSSDGSIANNKLTYHDGNSNNPIVYSNAPATTSTVAPFQILDQLTPPQVAPTITCSNSGGSLAAATHFFKIIFNNTTAGQTTVSPEASCATTGASGSVVVTAPTLPTNATGYTVYDSNTTNTELQQAASNACVNISANCTVTVLAAGAAVPGSNTASACPTAHTALPGEEYCTSSDGTLANTIEQHSTQISAPALITNTPPTITTPGTGASWFGTEGTEPASIASGTSGIVEDSTLHCPVAWFNAVNEGCVLTTAASQIQSGENSIVADSAAINTTETVIVKSAAAMPANRLTAGTVIRAVLEGTCTSTVANISTFAIRFGTAGTTADTLALSAPTSVAATTGTAIPFRMVITLTVRTTGSSATAMGFATLVNQGTTGIVATATNVVLPTMTTFNTTTADFIDVTYKSAATTTTTTFKEAYIDVIVK